MSNKLVFFLRRIATSAEGGTFGVLIVKHIPFAITLEDSWINNKKEISCIPNGSYLCKRTNSPKFGETFMVQDVPNRTHILFHKGNTMEDTQGCILIGETFENEQIMYSGKGFSEFMQLLNGHEDFALVIEWCC